MDLHIYPETVSFQALDFMEEASYSSTRSGYFADNWFSNVWYHVDARGAGVWRKIQGENFWFRDEVVSAFLQPHEYMAYHLVKAGASEQEVGDLIIDEFKRFRTLCHPFGECNSVTHGDPVIRDKHQRMAKNLDWQWRNDAGFFERVSIRTIFHSMPPEVRTRFLQRWHDEFGCFDSSHKGE